MRYAGTGDLPPNSKGGAFIHDPKISGEREVLAQVKLAFINTNGIQMICTRSMQLIIKKTARTFKTLEGQLLAINQGERTTLSTRCAELDVQMPLYLGVSKSVLDYVIFCHQEDSLWPLAEPSVVKKRFDEIFEATKFTKALDNIKTLRKEYSVNIKTGEKDVLYLKQDKERADKAQAKINGLTEDMQRYEDEIQMIEEQMDSVTRESQRIFESNQKFQEIIYKLEHSRKAKKMAESSIDRLSKDMIVMTESDEQLESLVENFEANTEEKKKEKDNVENLLIKFKSELESVRREQNKVILMEGQLKGEANAYQEQIKTRDQYMVDKIRNQHLEKSPTDLSFDSMTVSAFTKLLEVNRARIKTLIEKERVTSSQSENRISQNLNDINSKKLLEEQKVISLKDQIRNWESEIAQLESSIDLINVDEGTLDYERSSLKELEDALDYNNDKLFKLENEGGLKEKQKDMSRIEEQLDQYNTRLAKSTEQTEDRAKYKFLQTDIQKRESSLQALLDSHSVIFKSVIGKELDQLLAETHIREASSTTQSKIETCMSNVENFKKDVSQGEARVQDAKKNLDSLIKESNELEKEIRQFLPENIPASGYEKFREEKSKEHLISVGNVEFNNFLIDYTKSAIDNANKEHTCALCNRGFHGDEEQTFLSYLKSREESLPQMLEESNEELKKYEILMQNLTQISPAVSRFSVLSDSLIPVTKSELDDLENIVAKDQGQYRRESDCLDSLKDTLSEIERLRRVSSDISRMVREIESLKSQCMDLEGKLVNSHGGTLIDDVQEHISTLNGESGKLKRLINDLIEQRENLRSEISYLLGNISTKKIEINKQENDLRDKSNKQKQIVDLKSRIWNAKEESRKCDISLEEIFPQLRDQQNLLSELKRDSAIRENGLNESLNEILGFINEFASFNTAISEYEKNRGKERLENIQQQVTETSVKIRSIESSITKTSEELTSLEHKLLDLKGHFRVINDNIEVRKLQAEVETLDKTIKDLEEMHAEKEKAAYDKEVERVRDKLGKLNSQYSSKQGEVKQMEDQVEHLNQELTTEYLGIHEKYRKALIKLQTTVVANDDLAKYSKAMDSAIMKYHSMKMEEINRIIDELWKKTYTGTDVDTIVIRCETENAKGNKTYNYRVCMIKQDVELDMRGRCSAGQKVLASIIIRLALSECFGVNCGLIALDEPTTNLDSENIESLARSLSSIIEMRRVQKNFQLIIITHDETFLTHMNASAYTDHFFKVSRDSRQHSQIHCIPIGRVVN